VKIRSVIESSTVVNPAPACGVPRACRFQNPSESTYRRNRRPACNLRLVASGSGSAAAFTRAHSSRNSARDTRPASSTSRCSSAGFAAAAAETNPTCAADNSPRRSAVSTSGCPANRVEVSTTSLTDPADVPAARANSSAAVLLPDRPG
jgi:hypothetical protein